uniref:hypothetical protein n=2 Tax=Sphingomonadaceae TaxID=41297 RepID=UPI0037047187
MPQRAAADPLGLSGILVAMSYIRRKRSTTCPSIRHPAAEDEARRLIAEYGGTALRLVENRLDHQLASGDVAAALHLDQVRRSISKANVENDNFANTSVA